MKEFFATTGVQRAMLLIDWGERRIRLLDNVPNEQAFVRVNRAMQVRGLFPHVLVTVDTSESGGMVVRDDVESQRFTQPEAAIRDCYDTFLDGLGRFGSYLETGLTDVPSLRPYIGYCIDDISEKASSPADAAWNAALLTYVGYYRFSAVIALFMVFEKDITPQSQLYRSFLAAMADQELAAAFANCVGVEYP